MVSSTTNWASRSNGPRRRILMAKNGVTSGGGEHRASLVVQVAQLERELNDQRAQTAALKNNMLNIFLRDLEERQAEASHVNAVVLRLTKTVEELREMGGG